MTAPVNGAGGAGNAAPTGGTSTFKASDALQNGTFTMDFQSEGPAKAYGGMLAMLGETGGKAVATKIEAKMTDWIKAHPGADKTAFDAQLRKFLQLDTMQYKLMQDSINKMMRDIEAKMKEIAADRFG
jgi:hypothetical protein